jgi:hypothetical protein
MRKILLAVLGVALSSLHYTSAAYAQATRTWVSGPGIVIVPTGATTVGVVLTDVQSTSNNFGVAAAAGARVTATRSVFSWNAAAGVEADANAFLILDGNVMSNNGIGVQASPGSGVFLANNLIASNNTGVSGATTSHGNNRIDANVGAGIAPTVVGQQ